MQMLGANAEYVKIARSGPNAVDMHIAYYVGRLLEKEPNAVIHIISKDTDFDPLIEYLHAKGSACKRVKSIAEIPKHVAQRAAAPRGESRVKPTPHVPSPRRPHAEKLAPIIKHLHSLSGKPATSKKLDADHRQLLQTTWRRAARQDRGIAHRRAGAAEIRDPDRTAR